MNILTDKMNISMVQLKINKWLFIDYYVKFSFLNTLIK